MRGTAVTASQEDRDDLEVLGRVMDARDTPTLKGKRPAPAQFMGLLRFSVEETPRYAQALRRLLDRQVLVIAHAGNKWALSEVGGNSTRERARLLAETTDPAARLRQIAVDLRRLKARIASGVEDADPLTEQAAILVDEAADLAEGMAG